jgi:ABC-type amino acid transport substrate-binding protein
MQGILSVLAIFALCAFAPAPVMAQQDATLSDRPFIVATRHVPPFAIRDPDGTWEGISIALWEAIAADLGIEYRIRELGLQEMLQGVKDGEVDAAVAALTVTSAREGEMDFSHPFLNTGLGIAVPKSGRGSWTTVATRFISGPFLVLVSGLLGLLLAVGLVVWLFERRRNEQFGGSAAEGIGSGLWWSAVTMTTVGYGDKAPSSVGGRAVAMVWMFVSVVITSSFTAAIATALTVGQLGGKVRGEQDLAHARVLTLKGSTSANYLAARHYGFGTAPDLPAALQAVADGKADALVYDAPLLSHQVNASFADRLMVLPQTFEHQDYGIALPSGSPYREPINRAMLKFLHGEHWRELLERYLGHQG